MISYLVGVLKVKRSICMHRQRSFHEGEFNPGKLLTNSKCLQEKIYFHASETMIHLCRLVKIFPGTTISIWQPLKMEEHKVFGILRNPESDHLMFDITDLARVTINLQPTKRNLVSRCYDPVNIRFKILFQNFCQNKSDWDEVIASNFDRKVEWLGLRSQ